MASWIASSEKELSRTSIERHKHIFFSFFLNTKRLAKSSHKILDFCFVEESQHLFLLPYFARYLVYFLQTIITQAKMLCAIPKKIEAIKIPLRYQPLMNHKAQRFLSLAPCS